MAVAEFFGKAVAVVNRRRTPLKFFADAAQFADEFGGLADRTVSVVDLFAGSFQIRGQLHAAVRTEKSILIRVIPEITFVVHGKIFLEKL